MKNNEKLELKIDVIRFGNEDVIAASQPPEHNDELNGEWV